MYCDLRPADVAYTLIRSVEGVLLNYHDRNDGNVVVPTNVGMVGRYFLRRFALAQRKSNNLRVQYANALADTIVVFVGLPIASVTSFGIATSAKWGAQLLARAFGTALQLDALMLGAVVMLVGSLLLNKRMKKYLEDDANCYTQFATEKDARIVFWQKVSALIIFGVGPLLLAVVVLGR
jgi:hypothetical protein